jgi:hypothetical protein
MLGALIVTVMLSLCIPGRHMGGLAFLILALGGDKKSWLHARPLCAWVKIHWYPLNTRLGGSHSYLDNWEKR